MSLGRGEGPFPGAELGRSPLHPAAQEVGVSVFEAVGVMGELELRQGSVGRGEAELGGVGRHDGLDHLRGGLHEPGAGQAELGLVAAGDHHVGAELRDQRRQHPDRLDAPRRSTGCRARGKTTTARPDPSRYPLPSATQETAGTRVRRPTMPRSQSTLTRPSASAEAERASIPGQRRPAAKLWQFGRL